MNPGSLEKKISRDIFKNWASVPFISWQVNYVLITSMDSQRNLEKSSLLPNLKIFI